MPNSLDLPLHVFQVLEEEYISLYGHLEQETKIRLRDREVTSALNWDFQQGHIIDLVAFKTCLQEPNLNLPSNLREELKNENVPNWNEERARVSLNRILGRYIYDWKECTKFKLRATTEKLFELYPHHDLSQISLDELRRLNRFLLEDLFPKHLEKVNDIRLAAIYERRHSKASAALCLSGGGIRSGTFALGLLQGLARQGLLPQFDYLSTVSGGGYIGAWLTAWIHRHPRPNRGLSGVIGSLTNASPESKFDPEPAAMHHLRENSNFLTPQVGLMSADTWSFVAIYLRNLLLNWSVLIPLLLALLMIPRFAVAVVLAQPKQPVIRYPILLLGLVSVSWAIAYIAFSRPGLRTRLIEDNPWWKDRMGQRGFLKFCLLWLAVAGITLTSYWAWTPNEKEWWHFLLFGLATSSFGLLLSIFVLNPWRKIVKTLRKKRFAWPPPLFYGTLLFAGTLMVVYWRWALETQWWHFLLILLGVASVGWLISIIKRGTWRESRVIAALLLLTAGAVGGLIAQAATLLIERQRLLYVQDGWATGVYVSYAVPFFFLLFMLALIVFAGISSHFYGKITEEDREWWARFSAWTLIFAIAWAVFSTLVIFGPLALLAFPKVLGTVGGVSGLVALLLGRSAKTPATSEQVSQGGPRAQLSSLLLPVLAVLFIAVLIAGLSLLTSKLTGPVSSAVDSVICGSPPTRCLDPQRVSTLADLSAPPIFGQPREIRIPVQIGETRIGEFSPTAVEPTQIPDYDAINHMRAVHYPRWWLVAGVMLVLLGFGLFMARVINLNLFSLHNSYRSRLIRGFLAASRDKQLRQPNPFTGFDPADNVPMHSLRPALLHEVDIKNFDDFINQFKFGGDSFKNKEAKHKQSVEDARDENERVRLLAEKVKIETASEFIYTKLSGKVKALIDEKEEKTPASQDLRANLLEDLNRILEDGAIELSEAPGFKQPDATPAQQSPKVPASQELGYHIHRNRCAMEQYYSQFIIESDYPPHRLLHVVNTTLNLVGGDNLAWQQRLAEPFTISPLHCGSYRVGYRRSKDYGGEDGISLGTAMAISGAAASSNMGYYTTSPVLSLVLTLFNVRLGWWLGNPGPAGSHSYKGLKTEERPDAASRKIYRRMSPTFSVAPVLYEAFGLTDDRSNYVYLTDGGHFENLALYEMVLRRCALIVVSDAAADPKYRFNDLANAVRKIRIDLGVPIEFPEVPIYGQSPSKGDERGCYWAIGLIRYSQVDLRTNRDKAKDGILIYIKPAVYGGEPEDVVHYKRTHPTFPNETTADQFFDEPQFESYRALGSYIMDRMCGLPSGEMSRAKFMRRARQNLLKMAPQMKKYEDFWADVEASEKMPNQ